MPNLAVRTEVDRTYWADEPEPDKFVSRLREKVDRYFGVFETSGLRRRIWRSWCYVNGLFFREALNSSAIARLGQFGEYAGLAVNEMRAQMQQIVAMITKARPAVEILGRNSDIATTRQVAQAKVLAQFYLNKAEPYIAKAVEDALVFNAGYIKTSWDPSAGPEYDADEMGNILHAGDVKYSCPSIRDVVYDPRVEDWSKLRWVLIRERELKYDLIAKYPELEDEILGASYDNLTSGKAHEWRGFCLDTEDTADYVDKWCFYHIPTPAMPLGRYAEFVGQTLLPDYEYMPMLYDQIPLDRIVAGEMTGTCFGYSPLLDMQGPQEFFNATRSMIATNQAATGTARFWCRADDKPEYEEVAEGMAWVTSNTKPEVLDLSKNNTELYNSANMSLADMQRISGINDVRRGNPEGALKGGSGAAFALLDAKALEANSRLQASADRAIEGIVTKSLKILNHFPGHPRKLVIPGVMQRPYEVTIQKGGFSLIDSVQVRRGNPLQYTMAGRMQLAEMLVPTGLVPAEKMAKFLDDGDYQALVESITPATSIIHSENESFLNGEAIAAALATDNHVLHIREHVALLSTPEVRNLPGFADLVLAHVMEHVQLALNPEFAPIQLFLGQSPPGMPALGAPNQPGQNPSEPGRAGQPNQPKAKQYQGPDGDMSQAA